MSGRDANQLAAPEVQAVRDMVWALRLELPAEVWSDVELRVEAIVARVTDLEAQVAAAETKGYENGYRIAEDDLRAAEAQVAALTQERDGLRGDVQFQYERRKGAEAALATTRQELEAVGRWLALMEGLTVSAADLANILPDIEGALAATDSDTVGRCPGNLPASSCCGAPDGECIHP